MFIEKKKIIKILKNVIIYNNNENKIILLI